MTTFAIAIHGGAGTITRQSMSSEKERAYTLGLESAIDKGFEVLRQGGSAIEAVRAATIRLEDNILFNAGKGAVFTKEGTQEMDAAIMEGSHLMAGSVSGVRNIRNPIELAYTVMTKSEHVMLSGAGAAAFAAMHQLPTEPDEYFYSDFRKQQWEQLQETGGTALDHDVMPREKKMGTVGAVALDKLGNLAAATSTGGMTNKQFGRIGDSPVIGAGTYANNNTCAISCTGHGEPFIRAVTAYDVSCLMEYRGMSLQEAMQHVVHKKLLTLDGEGGMIGVDGKGNIEMQFNSEGMYRASRMSSGKTFVGIYK